MLKKFLFTTAIIAFTAGVADAQLIGGGANASASGALTTPNSSGRLTAGGALKH